MRVKNFVLLTVAAFVATWAFVPAGGHAYDIGCFQRWTIFIKTNGLGHAYELAGLDYNPLFLELLAIFGRLQGSVARLTSSFFTFKLFVLLFDFAAVYLTAYMLRQKGRNIALAFLVLFNFAYIYNTLFWGQVDSVFSVFVAFSIFFATRKRVLASLLCVLLAVNLKLAAIAFVPLVGVLNLPEVLRNRRALLRALPVLLVVQVLIFVPFLSADKLHAIVVANQNQLRISGATSPSGNNLWYMFFGDNATNVPASTGFLHITYKAWGVIMFAVAVAVILVPWFKRAVREKLELDDTYVFLVSALYGLAFYFFTTGMHERYSHPVILLLGIYAVLSGNYFTYVLASIAYFANLEKGLYYFHLNSYDTLIFDRAFGGAMFLVVLVVGLVQLYRAAPAAAREREPRAGAGDVPASGLRLSSGGS